MGNRQGDTEQLWNPKLHLKTGALSNTWSICVLVQCPEDKIPENDRRCLAWKSFHFAFYRFIEEKSSFEYGQVNHALAAAMRTLIKEYMILITQLEHLQRQGLLSLQKLWFYIQPTMRTLEILASLGEFQKYSHYILTGAWQWLLETLHSSNTERAYVILILCYIKKESQRESYLSEHCSFLRVVSSRAESALQSCHEASPCLLPSQSMPFGSVVSTTAVSAQLLSKCLSSCVWMYNHKPIQPEGTPGTF